MNKIYKLFVLFFFIYNLSFNIENCICQWQQTAGPQGSNIISLYSPNQKTIFAGTHGDGIFRSNNLGAKWHPVNTGLPDGNPRYDYAFTSNVSYLFVGTQNGVYRSSSNGNSWEPSNTGIENLIIFGLINKSVSGTNYLFAGTSEGVFKSSDNGNSWTSTGLNFWINALTFKTKNGISLFAAASSGYGVFRSDDFGATWINVNNELPPNMIINDIIAVGKNIFIGTYGNGVFLSTKNCANMSSLEIESHVISDFDVKSFTYFNNSLYAGTSTGIYKSTNLGVNWFTLNPGFTDNYVNKIYSFAYNFFAGTQGAIYASFNEGENWEPVIDGLPYLSVTCIAAKNNKLFAGTDSFGASFSDDNADTWYPVNKGGNKYINMLGIRGNTIFEGTKAGIFRSTNNGKEWIHIDYSGTPFDHYSFASNNTFAFAGINFEHHDANNGSVLRSSDDGLTWTEVLTGSVSALAVNNSNIFAGCPDKRQSPGKIFRSTNDGTDWTEVMGENITSLALKGTTIFAGTSENGIFRSTDNGNTWNQFNNGLTDTAINALVYTTNENRVFAATISGIFYTTIKGTKWFKINAGLTNTEIYTLATDNDFVYAGVSNMGLWRYSLAKMNAPAFVLNNETPSTFSISQNYPNPFNPTTNIRYEIPKNSIVKLVVFDALGREIITLVNEQLNPGTYESTFNASQYPSGVYFYRLITDGFSETKKMVLLK